MRSIGAVVSEWDWEAGGERNHEVDWLVEIDGDLDAPRLEVGKHDRFAWVGPDDAHLLMEGRSDTETAQRDIVLAAMRLP